MKFLKLMSLCLGLLCYPLDASALTKPCINQTDSIETIIGDYQSFFSDLLTRTEERGIAIRGKPLVQLLYRTETFSEYEKSRDRLKPFCEEWVETHFNGRPISILLLKSPLVLEGGSTVSAIELPAPKTEHAHASGLESVGIFIEKLPEFKEHYRDQLTGIKDYGEHYHPAFITFENDKTIKFYDYTLKEMILEQGGCFEQATS